MRVHGCLSSLIQRQRSSIVNSSVSAKRFIHAPRDAERIKILFCSSDDFGAASLGRLAEEKSRHDSVVESIDVVCKEGKPQGRGLKEIRPPPIKSLADRLSLPIHEISTFTSWTPPHVIDLVIAVSFALKVPPRLLKLSRYGGWNLHPSLLPDLFGPAPLQHTLLEGRTSFGITLQTLADQFDQGSIVSQSAFDVPNGGKCSYNELRDYAAPLAADMLISSLRDGAFRSAENHRPQPVKKQDVTYARKLTSEDRQVDWNTWTSSRVLRTQRALGSLWSHVPPSGQKKQWRVQWHDLQRVAMREDEGDIMSDSSKGEPSMSLLKASADVELWDEQNRVILSTCDGERLSPSSVTVEGEPKYISPARAMHKLHIWRGPGFVA